MIDSGVFCGVADFLAPSSCYLSDKRELIPRTFSGKYFEFGYPAGTFVTLRATENKSKSSVKKYEF
ncbi:hypothetical protein [Acidocella aminolytica]|uniref:Uncharacterized protein n=1 Tax=Acidocella aminolytica 101 = DSM 11237 TaxID=1120923 RepID=A0A0D6PK62_9PROT|nr:hypothetical protein [Acidocella aminolytica]GAN82195.1 hypothetical protein Aam_173_009 [Acidocella aminolytica 101 = DSM 11237]GBQ34945.1 hypothetical protein AA11237_0864 [Acidocella aminolytica 101 = DSM 11237]